MDTPGAHAIDTIADLRRHLQWAIELEHATIPPYLCALYSLDPARNPEAAQVVGSVLAEEMIHLALAANLLNAVGGSQPLGQHGRDGRTSQRRGEPDDLVRVRSDREGLLCPPICRGGASSPRPGQR